MDLKVTLQNILVQIGPVVIMSDFGFGCENFRQQVIMMQEPPKVLNIIK